MVNLASPGKIFRDIMILPKKANIQIPLGRAVHLGRLFCYEKERSHGIGKPTPCDTEAAAPLTEVSNGGPFFRRAGHGSGMEQGLLQ